MRITQAGRTLLEARVRAEPGDNLITEDFYTQLPQIRLIADPTSRQKQPDAPVDVSLDDTDVTRLVECAIRHPSANMRHAVLAAIRAHADSFREIFRFGLDAPAGFPEIGKIVAEALGERATAASGTADRGGQGQPLLPRMPLPAHLRRRDG